jgi:hypothetical protein
MNDCGIRISDCGFNMPDWKTEIKQRLANLKLEPTREAEVTEELSQHLDGRYQELLAGGATNDEASQAAFAQLSPLLAKELRGVEEAVTQEPVVLGSDTRRNIVGGVWQDLRYGARMLLKQKGFTMVAVLSLALGIGANTAIFSVCNAVLFKPLPYTEPDRIVMLSERTPDGELSTVAPANFVDWRNGSRSFSGMAAVRASSFASSFILGGQSEASRLAGGDVSWNFFSVLGVRFALGRNFLPDEDLPGRDRVAILSYGAWSERFGADRDIAGKAITLNDDPTIVVRAEIPAGAAAGELRAAVSAIDPAIAVDRIETMQQLVSGSVAQPRFRTMILAAFSLLALVMASIGIYGVMNYLVIQRTREFGIRLSLGATPTDVLRLVLGRAATLIGAGTCLGLVGSVLLVRLITKLLFGTGPLDPLTFAAVPALLAAVALAASYIPARRATKVDPMVALRYE